MKTLVTGATGFFGPHVISALTDCGYDVKGVGSSDYDLMLIDQYEEMFKDIRPDYIIHMAALTGGILKNKNYPADMWYHNMMINPPILKLSVKYGVKKIVYILPGCAYPSDCKYNELELWDGYPDEYPAPFSLSRKMMLVGCKSFKQQYGLDYSVIIPGNMYGEHDCFNLKDCHVIPAMIRKMHESSGVVESWGTGSAIRDFVYAGDVAKCVPFFLQNNITGPVNISNGYGISIRDLVYQIRSIVNPSVDIRWNSSMPEGPSEKIFDVTYMKSLGLSCNTTLEEGIYKTYKWFIENIPILGESDN